MKLYCKKFGFIGETEVSFKERRLVTQGLDIKTVCSLWKWYYYIPPFEKIFLVVPKRVFFMTEQKTFATNKSVKELFKEQGVEIICEEVYE